MTTVEVSSGGLSVRSNAELAAVGRVRLRLRVPGWYAINIRAFLTWERQEREKVHGLRFDPTDDSRIRVRSWIDQSPEIT